MLKELTMINFIGALLLLLSSIFLIVVVILQESKSNGMSAVSGGSSDSFIGKNGGSRTKEARLARLTKIIAIFFFVVAVGLNLVAFLVK